jgi:hypothetical protein
MEQMKTEDMDGHRDREAWSSSTETEHGSEVPREHGWSEEEHGAEA